MISVIILVYNFGDYLHFCLNSVLKQTYQNFEVICIDDASTDNSLDILEYFSKKDSRVKVLKNNIRKGFGYSKNRCLNEAQGDFIIFLNGNEWFIFNTLELLINHVKNNKLDVLFFKSVFCDKKGNFFIEDFQNKNLLQFENQVFNHRDLQKTDLFQLEKIFSKQFYSHSFLEDNEIYFPNEVMFTENTFYSLKVITSAKNISLINSSLCNTHKEVQNLLDLNPERLFDCFNDVELILEVFLNNMQLYTYYKKELLNNIFKELYDKYCAIDNQFKKRFFGEVQNVFKNFIKNKYFYVDILNYVDEYILNFFKFDDIIYKINNPPKISIVIPIYNTERYLHTLLDSITNQTIGFENIEVILIDDCSIDKSGEIIDSYSKKYENIFSIHLYENSGSPSKPRNIGIRNATSDYIIFQDSDDSFILDACEILYDTMVNEDVDFVTGMIMRNDEDIKNFNLKLDPWNSLLKQYSELEKEGIEKLLSSNNLFKLKINSLDENKVILTDPALNSKLFKKSFLRKNKIKFTEYLNGGEDSIFLLTAYIKAESIIFINKAIYNYNIHRNESLTHNYSLKTIQTRPIAYQLMYEISVLNNKKDIFIETVLWRKLNYWINKHLIKAHNLNFEDIISIFKLHQFLFYECSFYPNLPEFLKEICEDIKNGSFYEAAQKIMEKQSEYS